jgi:hypothetical protein
MIFFAYFRNKVRGMYAWSFALLMLLSSGSMQLALHNCPGSGIFVFSDCGMHNSEENHDIPECCKKKFPAKTKQQNCNNCEEYFVFSITPKYGSITTAEAGAPPVFSISNNSYVNPDITCLQPGYINFIKNKVPPKLPDLQALHCSLLI